MPRSTALQRISSIIFSISFSQHSSLSEYFLARSYEEKLKNEKHRSVQYQLKENQNTKQCTQESKAKKLVSGVHPDYSEI